MPTSSRFLILTAFVLFPATAIGNELLLEWTSELPAGAQQLFVEHYLQDRGIRPVLFKGGFTYTSKFTASDRDYLFCNERLSSIIEGERVDGDRFNYWLSAFLATQKKYGDPTTIKYDHDWRHILFQWKLAGKTTLHFLIRGVAPDVIIWTRELVHEPTSRPCMNTPQ